MIGFLIMLLIAAVIGFLGESLAPGNVPGGWLGAIVAGIVGSSLGGYLFGAFGLPVGPSLAGFALIPSIIGAALVVALFGAISRTLSRGSR
jgi:uncharacterized membrane protein YeaQ/YmgE (transglycosylase-associated protein family)